MKQLIINADDLGLTPGITRGIMDAHLKGVVTSTSALMNSPYIINSLALAKQVAPNLGIGVHLVLTRGKPLLPPDDVPTLVDRHWNFYKLHQLIKRVENLNLTEVHAEWQAQIEAFIATGRQPDHLDSHHHSSYSNQGLFTVMLELAREYNLPIRHPSIPENEYPGNETMNAVLGKYSIRSPQVCITSFYGQAVNMANLAVILSTIPKGVSELMCHPGYADSELIKGSSYNTAREQELHLLTSLEAKAALENNQVRLTSFSTLC